VSEEELNEQLNQIIQQHPQINGQALHTILCMDRDLLIELSLFQVREGKTTQEEHDNWLKQHNTEIEWIMNEFKRRKQISNQPLQIKTKEDKSGY